MRRIVVTSAALLLVAAVLATAAAKSAPVQLREGLYAEEVEGNLDAAIKIYQQIIDDKTAARDQVAQALYRQGMCYMKKKNETEAKADFARIVAEHSDQTDLVAKVKPMLDELGNADPAALMPPETLLYVEIGSPGKQVEKILNMLKGTPLENPLAAVNAGPATGQQGPAAIISALMNPSMLAEFKKIRGMGVGIQEIGQGTPSAMIVMYPGKSDALRGILQMIIAVAGTQPEVVDGMQTVRCGKEGAAAYDDTVVIVAIGPGTKGPDRLKWAIQQYKGLTHNPTLATSNKAFAKVNKKSRQENVLTLWVNVDEAYQTMLKQMPPDQVPQQIRVADGMVDLKNVDEIIAGFTLQESGVALEVNVGFKDGHHCMAYNLIHTPNLNTALLKAVPAEASVLIAFALGDPNTAQAQAAGQQIKNITGLDIGREIFANIKQVALFAVPPTQPIDMNNGVAAFVKECVGLAVTSNDPAQTRMVLATLLRSAGLMAPAPDGQAQDIKVVNGRFQIDLISNMQVLGYVDETGRTTVLALGSGMVDRSIKAVRQKNSVLDSGRLKNAIAALPATTSKLVVVDVGGQMQLAALVSRSDDPNAQERVRKAFGQLAQACAQTTVVLRTAEETNNLNARLEISGLPKADQLVGPISDIMSVIQSSQSAAWASGEQQEMEMPVNLTKASAQPVIDGKVDEVWAAARSYDLKNSLYKPVAGPADGSASFKALYDADNLYFLVDVNDETLKHDSSEFYDDDCVEIFIDADNDRSPTYDSDDHSYYFVWDAAAPIMGKDRQPAKDGARFAFAKTDKGYRLEVQFAWATLGVKPLPGTMFGLDVHVDDDDDGGTRDSKLTWNGKTDDAWQNPRVLGTAQIPGLVGWWKLDEKDGRTAADSSGNNHAATVQGNPDWQPAAGKLGGTIALGGDGDFLDVADTAAFNCIGAVTLAAWIKAEKLDRPWQAIITKGDNAYRVQRNNETDTLEFACTGLKIANGNEYGSLFGSRKLPLKEWHHVAGVYDGTKMYLYMDGVLDTSQEASGTIRTNDVRLQIGGNTEPGDRFWSGLIDDVRVYNYPLSPTEIAALAAGK